MSIQITARQEASALLTHSIGQWEQGTGGVVFIRGQAGAGKSFILDEIEHYLGSAAIRVDCRPPIGSFNVAGIQPLQPFGLVIERLYQNSGQAAKKRLAVNIGMSLLASLPIAGDIFYAIKSVRQDVSEFQRETAALAHKKRAAVDECIDALTAAHQQQPFVLLVDDGHWSDPQSIEVLRRLMLLPKAPLIIWAFNAATAKQHNLSLTALSEEPAAVRLELGAVTVNEFPALLHSIAPSLVVTPEQLTVIHERSAGLPGIVHEYVRYWEKHGQISANGTLKEDVLQSTSIRMDGHPATMEKLHEISDDDATFLGLCALEGREFTAFLVAALTNTSVVNTIRRLRSIERATGIVQNVGLRTRYGVKTTTFFFTADLPYTYFVNFLSYEEKKELHQRIVDILSAERSNSSIEAIRDQLSMLIAAHSIAANNDTVATEMLTESYRYASETGSDLTAAIILEELRQLDSAMPDAVTSADDAQNTERDNASLPQNGVSVPVSEQLRLAADAIIQGKPDQALRYLHTTHPAITATEQVLRYCLMARACAGIERYSQAEEYLMHAEQIAADTNALRVYTLNMRALVAGFQNNTSLALDYIQQAAKIAADAPANSNLLTLGNAMLLDAKNQPPTQKQKLLRILKQRNWKHLAADLGLAVIATLVFLTGSALNLMAADTDGFNTLRARSMETAHPTPDAGKISKYRRLKVPFVQGTTTFPSQFANVSLIADEDDAQPMQNESSVAINPLNPDNLIGSAVDYRKESQTWAYYTTNAGKTWNNVSLGYPHQGWRSTNDPSVCFDHLGRGYLCYGGFNVTKSQFGENGVYVSLTDDGGLTWHKTHIPVIEHVGPQTVDSSFEDKYYIHADTCITSPFRGRLYIPWKRVINKDSSTQIVIAHSTNRGLSWQPPVAVSNRFPGTSEHATFGQSFPLARTGPDGSVYLVWNSGTESAIRFARSTDGGLTFSDPSVVFNYKSFGEKREVAGVVNSRVKQSVRAEAYPTLCVDNTNGPRRGWLYLVWSADNYPNVYFSRSTNAGASWSEPVVVHSDTTNDQFWPWIALDPLNGDLAVMYFDSRDDSANLLVNCYVSYSPDGGSTWVDKRVGDAENDLRNNPFQGRTFAGDYSGCDFYGGIVYPSWVDMRNTTASNTADSDVFTAIVHTRAPKAPDTFGAETIPDIPTAIDVSWSAVSKRVFEQPLTGTATYKLAREGTVIATLPLETTSFRDEGLTAYKEYHYSLTVVSGEDTSVTRKASAFAGGSKIPGAPVLLSATGSSNPVPPMMNLTVRLPRLRLDGTTPLINMAELRGTVGSVPFSVPLNSSDTGMVKEFTVAAPADGWFKSTVFVVDSAGNQSPVSNTVTAFAGNLYWQTERFDTLPNFWVLSGNWGLDTTFSYSEPASFTESPFTGYDKRMRDTVMLYPHVAGLVPEFDAVKLSWKVAAFVHPSDTVFLEMLPSSNMDGEWEQIAWWNSSLDARWADTTKGADAWRSGFHILRWTPDTVYLRLRFQSNLVNNSDGFYIDDITWDQLATVQDIAYQPPSRVFPTPARSAVRIELAAETIPADVTVYSADGARQYAPWHYQNKSVEINVQHLVPGVYTAVISKGAWITSVPVIVYR